MINIPMKQFISWFQAKIDDKYAMKMEPLKRLLISFYNLADQVLHLYNNIKQKMQKYTEKQEYRDIMTLLNRSLFIIAKINQIMPKCLDSDYCEKFIKAFQIDINMLCGYYHSLSHYDIINKENKYEKEKIVSGINKMYSIHLKIKESLKFNYDLIETLSLIAQYKAKFNSRITSIQNKLRLRRSSKDTSNENFQSQAVQFYDGLLEKIKIINEQPQAKKSLMKVYFQLIHQQYSAQAQLQVWLMDVMNICSQIRGRKKNISFVGQESVNNFTRWVNAILKPTISLKNIKKLKVEDFIKTISIILQEKDTMVPLYLEKFENNQPETQSLTVLIMQIAKELQKIQSSGLFSLISEYKDSLMPPGSKKFIHKLIQYQHEMNNFYHLHEEIKLLQKYVQTIVLQQLGLKVNIIIEENVDNEQGEVNISKNLLLQSKS